MLCKEQKDDNGYLPTLKCFPNVDMMVEVVQRTCKNIGELFD